jgi:uncharacterized protein involved in exopolysaccharide biosynthesis
LDEDIDLRPYIRELRKRWWWVLGLGLTFAVVVFVVSSLRPATYEASSFLVFTSQDSTAYKTLPTLATSDGVLQTIVEAYTPPPEAYIDPWTPAGLSQIVKASPGRDPSLVVLQVRNRSPQVSADIADVWADLLIKEYEEVYDVTDQDVAFLEGQLAQATEALDAADAELTEFQGRNRVTTLNAQLGAQEQALKDYLATQLIITNTIRDVKILREGLAQGPASQPVSRRQPDADSSADPGLQRRRFSPDPGYHQRIPFRYEQAGADLPPGEPGDHAPEQVGRQQSSVGGVGVGNTGFAA